MTVTIRQIAEKAGVSRGTVDRVLNGRERVKPEVRKKVLEIARELNYVPNVAGKALAYSKKPALFGVVLPPKEIRFFDEVMDGLAMAAGELKDMGVRLDFRHVGNTRPEEAAAAIRELVEEGANGILFAGMDDVLVRREIDWAAERHVPVVTFNSDVENCARVCFVGQDLRKSGLVAAGLMSGKLEAGGKVLVMTGNLKFHAHRTRVIAFAEGLAERNNGVVVAETLEGYDRYADTLELLDQALLRHPDAVGIYMATGTVKACLEAVAKHGLERKIRIVCNDLLPEIEQGLRERTIDFTIMQNPRQQGYRSLRILYELIFAGKRPEREFEYTETQICIAESL